MKQEMHLTLDNSKKCEEKELQFCAAYCLEHSFQQAVKTVDVVRVILGTTKQFRLFWTSEAENFIKRFPSGVGRSVVEETQNC